MEHSSSMLPLNFYCRNARFCTKKAAFSRKARLFADELLHLKKFLSLVTTIIPSHPQFEGQKTEKQIVELQTYVAETRRRIHQLEAELATSSRPFKLDSQNSGKARKARSSSSRPHLALPINFCSDPLYAQQKHQKVRGTGKAGGKKQVRNHDWQGHELRSFNHELAAGVPDSPSTCSSLSQLLKHELFDAPNGDVNLQQTSFGSFLLHTKGCSEEMNHETDADACEAMKSRHDNIHDGMMYRRESGSTANNPALGSASFHATTRASAPRHGSHHHHQHRPSSYTSRIHGDLGNCPIVVHPDQELGATDGDTASIAEAAPCNENVYRKDSFPSSFHPQGQQNRDRTFNPNHGARIVEESVLKSAHTDQHIHPMVVADEGSDTNLALKDGLSANIRTKLEEEYEKLKDQMKLLKCKDGILKKELVDLNHGSKDMTKRSHKLDEKLQACLASGEKHSKVVHVSAGHGHKHKHVDGDDLRSFHVSTDNQKKQKDVSISGRGSVATPSVSNFSEEKLCQSVNINPLIKGTPTPTPTPTPSFNSSLPFSHYISKLKQLVPSDQTSADTSDLSSLHHTPPLGCKTHTTPQPEHHGPPFDHSVRTTPGFDVHDRADRSNACLSPSSSDTFGESLTYSNPVFDLESEQGFVPDWNPRKIQSGHRFSHDNRSNGCKLDPHTKALPSPLREHEKDDCNSMGGHCYKVRSNKKFLEKRENCRDEEASSSKRTPMVSSQVQMKAADHGRLSSSYMDETKPAEYIGRDLGENYAKPTHGISFSCLDRGVNGPERSQLDVSYEPNAQKINGREEHLPTRPESKQGLKAKGSAPATVCEKSMETSKAFPESCNRNNPNMSNEFRDQFSSCLAAKIEQLERQLKDHKESSKREREFIKGYIDQDVLTKVDELVSTVQWAQKVLRDREDEKQNVDSGLHAKLEDCENKFKSLQGQMNEFPKEMVVKEMREKISVELQDVKDVCKTQIEDIERNMSRDMHTLRAELVSTVNTMQSRTEKQLENISLDALDGLILRKLKDRISQLTSIDRDAIAKLQEELHSVRKQIDQLCQGKEEIREQIGKLTKVSNEVSEDISRGNSMIQEKLNHLKKECLKSKSSNNEMRKEMQEIKESVQASLAQTREENRELIRSESEGLRKSMEQSLTNERKLYEQAILEVEDTMQHHAEMVKAFKEEFLRDQNRSNSGHGMLIDRIDQLSHFYHCGLEEMREDLHHVKVVGQGRLDEMEQRWEDFTMLRRQLQQSSDWGNSSSNTVHVGHGLGLEDRVLQIEHILQGSLTLASQQEQLQQAQVSVEGILSVIMRDQECASSAAAKAASMAREADEIFEAFRAELESAKADNLRFQETMHAENDAVAVACSEIKRMKSELVQEKDLAVAAASKARQRSFEIWEGLRKDMTNLRDSLLLIERDKEAASTAANEAASAASRAEVVLEELSNNISFIRKEGMGDDVMRSEKIEELEAAIRNIIQSISELNEQQKQHGCVLNDLSKDVAAGNAEQMGLTERVCDMAQKVQKLESSLFNLRQSVEHLQSSTQDMQKSSSQHHTTVGTILGQFEARIHHLENPFQSLEQDLGSKAEGQVDDVSMEKQQLLNLYKEMSSFFKKLQRMEGEVVDSDATNNDSQSCTSNNNNNNNAQENNSLSALETKVEELENRICHMESTTTLATRSLDSRLHLFDAQIQAAFAAAMTAEGKCSALGAELVKLFRTLAASKKENVPKTLDSHTGQNSLNKQMEKKTERGNRTKLSCPSSFRKGSPGTVKGSHASHYTDQSGASSNVRECRGHIMSARGRQNILRIEGCQRVLGHMDNTEGQALVVGTSRSMSSTDTSSMHTLKPASTSGNSNLSNFHTTSSDHSTEAYNYAESCPSCAAAQMFIHAGHHQDVNPYSNPNVKTGRIFSLAAENQIAACEFPSNENATHAGDSCEVATAYAANTYSTDGSSTVLNNVVRTESEKTMVLKGKLPVTHGKLAKRKIECTRKESIHVGGPASTDYQMTDMRLEGGRILVNVSHRSAFISGTRLVKQGDTFSAVKTGA